MVPQHGGAARSSTRSVGGLHPPCLTGSQLTRPTRTPGGGLRPHRAAPFTGHPPSPAQRGRVSAAFSSWRLWGAVGRGAARGRAPSASPRGLSGADDTPCLTQAWLRQDTGRCRPAGLRTPHGLLSRAECGHGLVAHLPQTALERQGQWVQGIPSGRRAGAEQRLPRPAEGGRPHKRAPSTALCGGRSRRGPGLVDRRPKNGSPGGTEKPNT